MGLWIDRDENGRKQTENSDLRYCCREHSSGLWWAGPASIALERRGAGADCLGQAGIFLLCSCAGRSTHICAWQTQLTLLWDRRAASRAALQVFSHDWHDLPVPRNAPVSGQCNAVREGGPCGAPHTTQSSSGGSHSAQQWCQSIPCAVKGPSTSLTPCLLLQLLTGLSWSSLFRHAVLLSHRNHVPQLTVTLKSEQLTKDLLTPIWWIFKINLLVLLKDLNLFNFTQEQLHQVQQLHTKRTELCKSGVLGKVSPLPGSDSKGPCSVTPSEHFHWHPG